MKCFITWKKVIAFVLMTCCLFTATFAYAIVPGNMNASSSKIVTYGINNVAEEQAEMLKALGLFIGTNNGFELHRHLTRTEAAALIVRFMGEEKNALAQINKHPFKDVQTVDKASQRFLLSETLCLQSVRLFI